MNDLARLLSLLHIPHFHTQCYYIIFKKEDVVCLPMRQLSRRDQMTQKLTIVHHTAFNIEQIPYSIVSYKRPRND